MMVQNGIIGSIQLEENIISSVIYGFILQKAENVLTDKQKIISLQIINHLKNPMENIFIMMIG